MPKKKRRKRRNRQPLILGAAAFVVVVGIIIAVMLSINVPGKKEADLYSLLGIMEGGKEAAIYLQDELVESKGYVENDAYYFELGFLQESFDEKFYWDGRENVLIYTTPTEVIKANVGSTDYYISKQKYSFDQIIVKTDGTNVYVSVAFAKLYADFQYEIYSDPNRIVVKNQWGTITNADVSRDTQIRTEMDIKSDIICQLSKGGTVRVIEQYGKWSKVQSKDGYIGYVQNKCLGKSSSSELTNDYTAPEYTSLTKDYTIEMVWHQVTNMDANGYLVDMTSSSKGITTVSPTWFSLCDTEGNFSSLSSSSYINLAHHIGYEVWALIDDFGTDGNGDHYVNQVLPYTSKRENLINQLIAEAIQYGIDGINIDFEYVSLDAAEDYIQFLRELSVKCRVNGIVLSVDNYVPADYNLYYDRTEQGILADYVIIMGYDEYNSSSKEAGPVASKKFVENGIVDTLLEVPADKVILGVPFYSRVWEETPEEYAEEGAEIIEDSLRGNYALYSYADTMEGIADTIEVIGGSKFWMEEAGYNYVEYEGGNSTYRIWVEDEQSLEVKMKLMQQYELAGVSCWALGQEKNSIWDIIIKYTN